MMGDFNKYPASSRSGGGGGLLYPDSAARPFASNTARNTWANNNKADLIKDTTVVNVGGTQWYLWTGESNPSSVQTSLWMDAAEIVPGEKGDTGDKGDFGQIVSADFVGNDIVFTDNSGNQATLSDAINTLKGDAGDKGDTGDSAYQVWLSLGNVGTEQDYLDSLKGDQGEKGDPGSAISLANASYYNDASEQYVVIEQYIPVVTSTPMSDGNLASLVGIDAVSGLMEVVAAVPPDLAAGVVVADAGQLYLLGTGIYSGIVTGSIGDKLYIDQFGAITKTVSDYPIGEIVRDGALIDIGLYRASTIDTQGGGIGSTLDVDGNETQSISTGTGITSAYDAGTKTTTLTVNPTNIDLSGYAELETDVAFSKVTIKNPTGPLFESVVNVTNGGNTEANLVGTTNIRKVDKTTGVTTDVMNINGTSGAVDLRTDVTYQGAINADDSLVNRQYVDSMAYYKGQGLGIPASTTISTNTVEQTTPVAYFENSLSHDSETIITIDESLVAAETIIKVSPLAQYSSKTFLLYHGATDNGEKTIRRGETWRIRLDASGTNHWVYERVDDGTRITRGLGDRLTPVEHPYVGVFQYAENMPYHLLLETPTSSRLVHEFPREKTFRFTPIETGRKFEDSVAINEANQGVATADLELGQYSDVPLYIIEPNVVVTRDQRAWINFPANMTLDVSAGFYVFGTVSGWCGNNTSEGNVGVYVGTSENFRSYTQNIGFVLGNSGVFLLDGQNLRTAQNSAAIQFNVEPGVTHMIRYAFYVDEVGLMTYYIVDLNTGQVSTGTQQCNIASLGSNPKMYVSYDRFGNNTAAIAIAETHLVVNSVGSAEGRWNWRN